MPTGGPTSFQRSAALTVSSCLFLLAVFRGCQAGEVPLPDTPVATPSPGGAAADGAPSSEAVPVATAPSAGASVAPAPPVAPPGGERLLPATKSGHFLPPEPGDSSQVAPSVPSALPKPQERPLLPATKSGAFIVPEPQNAAPEKAP